MSKAIPRLELAEMAPEVQQRLKPRIERLGYLGEFFKCTANAPEVLTSFFDFTEIAKNALPARIAEAVALTVAGFMGNAYERNQHERLCVKLEFGKDWVAAVNRLDPDHAPDLSDAERSVQRYVLAALERRGHDVEREFEAVARALSPAEAMTVVMFAGRYVAHALVVNTLRLEAPVASIFEEQS
jgi:hypothetical protein